MSGVSYRLAELYEHNALLDQLLKIVPRRPKALSAFIGTRAGRHVLSSINDLQSVVLSKLRALGMTPASRRDR